MTRCGSFPGALRWPWTGRASRPATCRARRRVARSRCTSATHPVTGDQLLCTEEREAWHCGYENVVQIGNLIARAPVTGELGIDRGVGVRWASSVWEDAVNPTSLDRLKQAIDELEHFTRSLAAVDEQDWPAELAEQCEGRLEGSRVLVLGGAPGDAPAFPGAAEVVERHGAWQELEGLFDIVCCDGLFHRVTEPMALLRKLRAFLADDGLLLVSSLLVADPERSSTYASSQRATPEILTFGSFQAAWRFAGWSKRRASRLMASSASGRARARGSRPCSRFCERVRFGKTPGLLTLKTELSTARGQRSNRGAPKREPASQLGFDRKLFEELRLQLELALVVPLLGAPSGRTDRRSPACSCRSSTAGALPSANANTAHKTRSP